MTVTSAGPTRAPDYEALAPLLELCKVGRLFDVQTWIRAGKPVNLPSGPGKGTRPHLPLEFAIDRGFHSLVQVLLEGGALQEPEGYNCPMNRALRLRRFDIVQLLVEHGFDCTEVDLREVFASWDPQIMEYFIDRGADIHQCIPFAFALCNRIRTALGPYKKCRECHPEVGEQGNIALRHHCKEGNLKWISLLLWAGANPFKPGTENPDEELDGDYDGLSALGFAALYGHFDVFELKAIHLLARHGAKWIPDDKHEMNSARRSLLQMKSDYAVEFVWIMSKYKACTHECVQSLLSTPTIKSHLAAHRQRIQELTGSW
jgi:ankyrin repeat protein